MARESVPHVVIVGAGFAGLEAAQTLASSGARITLIDRRNHHVFQPMLYQVATASLSPPDIAISIRSLFRRNANVSVLYEEVTGIDLDARCVFTGGGHCGYDYLILATGSEYNYFGHQDWPQHAPGLKSLADAQKLRRDILLAFEKAELEEDPGRQKELLTFVLIGAGPTGVELAGAISEIVKEGLADFRRLKRTLVEILLIEAGGEVLSAFPPRIRRYTERTLARRGVSILLNSRVEDIREDGVQVNGEFVPAATVIWCAGVKATPVGVWLKAETARGGAVLVEPDLSLPAAPDVFVAGDAAATRGKDGYLPGLASVAKQQGHYLGKLIAARIAGKREPGPFRYRDYGTMATIGRGAAAADFGFVQLTGVLAWMLWGLVHIYYLIGFRNRVTVFMHWMWTMMRFRRRNWLITGEENEPKHH